MAAVWVGIIVRSLCWRFLRREVRWRGRRYDAHAGAVLASPPVRIRAVLYRFDRVRKSYGPKEVLRDVTWQHNPGEKVGLVGRNGAGKTTLLRIALGREEPDAGEFVKANTVRIATVDQALRGRPRRERLHDFAAGAFAQLHAIESELRASSTGWPRATTRPRSTTATTR